VQPRRERDHAPKIAHAAHGDRGGGFAHRRARVTRAR
jgi:hypothetical protein